MILYNDANVAAFIKFGSTATKTSFTAKVQAAETFFNDGPIYTGAVDAIWDVSSTGGMSVTEC